MTPKNKLLPGILAVAIAAAFGFADSASAAATQANVRYTRGSACMKKFGYKL